MPVAKMEFRTAQQLLPNWIIWGLAHLYALEAVTKLGWIGAAVKGVKVGQPPHPAGIICGGWPIQAVLWLEWDGSLRKKTHSSRIERD